jgi:hypothetical protein
MAFDLGDLRFRIEGVGVKIFKNLICGCETVFIRSIVGDPN